MALPLPSHLPDLCLENIFKRVPLRDLLHSVRVVCTNWRRVLPTELKRRRSVVLVRDYQKDIEKIRDNDNPFRNDLMQHVRRENCSPWVPPLRPLDHICFDALLVPGGVLSEKFTSPLMDTLPVISNLTVVQYIVYNVLSFSVISCLKQMIRLINYYGNSLVSLKIDFVHYNEINPHKLRNDITTCTLYTSLLDSINQLESLRHLTLNGTLLSLTGTPRLSILSRLNTFTSIYIGTLLMDSFRQYAKGNVRIHCVLILPSREIFLIDPQLATIFISVSFDGILNVNHYDNMRQFGVRFTSLTRLRLSIHQIPMTMLARCLSPLTQLIVLEVIFMANVPQNEVPQPELAQVPAVRLLSLSSKSTAHFDTERLHLAELFPNLQVLKLSQHVVSCTECGLDNIEQMIEPNMNAEGRNRIEQCLRLARVPFRRCGNLHTIKLYGNVRDLLPRRLITPDEM